MLAHLPFVPVAMGIRVGTAILSYNGRIAFGVTSDLDSVPDPAVLADAIPVELARLLVAAKAAGAQTAGSGAAREVDSKR
jgi:hypothetical protein